MHWSHLLMRTTPIAGLEIGETYVRMALLEYRTRGTARLVVRATKEAELPAGTIVRGAIADKKPLIAALKSIFSGQTKYVIASIPAVDIFYKTYSFPKTVRDKKLEEAMELTIGFQLPIPTEEYYLDWERGDADEQEISLAAAKKKTVNAYMEALREAGLLVAAMEFHPLSVLRIIDTDEKGARIIHQTLSSAHVFMCAKGRTLSFVRSIPRIISEDPIRDTEAIVRFFATTAESTPSVTVLTDLHPVPALAGAPAIAEAPSSWVIALGAATRGLIPRNEDDLISLLPIGTEDAYRRQKMIAFTEFWSNVAIGISLLIVATLAGAWSFMVSLQERTIGETITRGVVTPEPTNDLEQRAIAWNTTVEKGAGIAEALPRWKEIVRSIAALPSPGIIIHSLTVSGAESPIEIRGTAQDRASLNAFKETLVGTPLFAQVNLPLTRLELARSIPFAISLRLADPGVVTAPPIR